jgi:hypothetical protein
VLARRSNIAVDSKDEMDHLATIRRIKEANVKVAFDYESELKNDNRSLEEKCYELPDGSIIELSKDCVFSPSEILFREINGNKSLTEMIETSL